jgi:hypothetical protein
LLPSSRGLHENSPNADWMIAGYDTWNAKER